MSDRCKWRKEMLEGLYNTVVAHSALTRKGRQCCQLSPLPPQPFFDVDRPSISAQSSHLTQAQASG